MPDYLQFFSIESGMNVREESNHYSIELLVCIVKKAKKYCQFIKWCKKPLCL